MHPNHLGSLKKHRCLDSPLGQLSPNLRAGGRTPEFFKSFLIESNVQPGLGTSCRIIHSLPLYWAFQDRHRQGANLPITRGVRVMQMAGLVRVFTSSVGGTGWLIENPQFLAWGGCAVYNTAVPSAGNGTSNSYGRFSERIGYTPRVREFKWTLSPSPPRPQHVKSLQTPLKGVLLCICSSSDAGLLDHNK